MPKQRRVKSSADMRGFLALVFNAVEGDEMDPQKGAKLAYIANILVRVIEGTDLERRNETLESRLLKE